MSLGSVADPALVLPAIADALGVTVERAEPVEDALAARLAERSVLFVLDNFEQVVEAAGSVAKLAERCSGTPVVITSRQVLHLRGEREHPLAPLDLPPAPAADLDTVTASPAVALFVARAQSARPAFD